MDTELKSRTFIDGWGKHDGAGKFKSESLAVEFVHDVLSKARTWDVESVEVTITINQPPSEDQDGASGHSNLARSSARRL